MTEPDLNALLSQSGQGDKRAFHHLYEAVVPRLLAIALRLLRDKHQAEDVVQQAMVSAWRSAGDFDPSRAQASTWLTAIVRYRALDLVRTQGRRRDILHDSQHDIREVFGHDPDAAESDPLSEHTIDRLEHCFGEISRDQAGCIQLAFLDGMTCSEIAQHRQTSIGTIKSWLRRGLAKLRECVNR
jgi:RNA polymerase sigma-70 factor (ECF subfamily)